jgi:hypothetical protein
LAVAAASGSVGRLSRSTIAGAPAPSPGTLTSARRPAGRGRSGGSGCHRMPAHANRTSHGQPGVNGASIIPANAVASTAQKPIRQCSRSPSRRRTSAPPSASSSATSHSPAPASPSSAVRERNTLCTGSPTLVYGMSKIVRTWLGDSAPNRPQP